MAKDGYRYTRRKMRENPNFKFHSQWHYDQHMRAHETRKREEFWGTAIGLVVFFVGFPLIYIFASP